MKDETIERESLAVAQAFVREEKESLVLDDRAANMTAELVAFEGRRLTRGKVEEVAGVERVVAQKLEHLAVEFAGAGASRDVDHRAGVLAVLGAEGRVGDPELLNRADRGRKVDRAIPHIVDSD